MKIQQWQMTAPSSEFSLVESTGTDELVQGEVLVKVAGCGVCHTDLSFWHHGVKTRHPLPLTLGHEISGTVIDGPAEWLGKNVIIPAVLPCGECELCKTGRSNICRQQRMPGNDFHGGFASHIRVPYRYLCTVPDAVLQRYSLGELSVIADAISTPYQAVKRAEIKQDDLAIVIGVGGVGIYAAEISALEGAKVLAIDISDEKLNMAKEHGIHAVLNSKDKDIKQVKEEVKELSKSTGARPVAWKIFEMSGTKAGQELAFNLITYASTLSIVGFTMDKLEVRLSNLMAFDAKIIGTWGCKPELYADVLELVGSGKLPIGDFIQTMPMSRINEVFRNTLEHKYSRRTVLLPDFN